jgi:hypothetical protein
VDLNGSQGPAASGSPGAPVEDAADKSSWASGAGREDAGETRTEQLLARGLKRWPGSSSRRGLCEPYAGQAFRCAEVGEFEVELPDVVVVRDGAAWR